MNLCRALSPSWVSGYTLQLIASRASFLNSIAWSQALFGGYHFDSSSPNTLAKSWYSFGTSILVVYCCACIASLVAIVRTMHYNSSVHIMSSFSLSVCLITISCMVWWGFTDLRTIVSIFSSMVACFQLNLSSYVASHGYPSTTSSFLILVMRNLISLWIPCVCTFRFM